MTDADDYDEVMLQLQRLDDATVDDILAGRDPGRDDLAALVDFARAARTLADGPAPAPSSALAAMLAGELTPGADLASGALNRPGRETRAVAERLPRRKRMAVALGVGLAVASVGGAGAAGALPGPAQHAVASAVDAITPFEFPDDGDTSANTPEDTTPNSGSDGHSDFGATTSSDATGESDGQKGVDGQSVSSSAAQNGLSTASDTPAGDHVPPTVGKPADPGSQSSNSSNSSNSNRGGPPASTPGDTHLPPSVPPGHP